MHPDCVNPTPDELPDLQPVTSQRHAPQPRTGRQYHSTMKALPEVGMVDHDRIQIQEKKIDATRQITTIKRASRPLRNTLVEANQIKQTNGPCIIMRLTGGQVVSSKEQ